VVFTKAITSLAGPDDDVTLPAGSVAGDWELRRGGQWCKGKSFDGFGPLGRQYQRVL
jgi:2-keto-4-pentenoate hydratase/2-oxohepta-3-ene-1,7-dioic acid hydratase in catechol pathway